MLTNKSEKVRCSFHPPYRIGHWTTLWIKSSHSYPSPLTARRRHIIHIECTQLRMICARHLCNYAVILICSRVPVIIYYQFRLWIWTINIVPHGWVEAIHVVEFAYALVHTYSLAVHCYDLVHSTVWYVLSYTYEYTVPYLLAISIRMRILYRVINNIVSLTKTGALRQCDTYTFTSCALDICLCFIQIWIEMCGFCRIFDFGRSKWQEFIDFQEMNVIKHSRKIVRKVSIGSFFF